MTEDGLFSVGKSMASLSDYISPGKYRLFKPHGSLNWARELDAPDFGPRELGPWPAVHEIIDQASNIRESDRFRMVGSERPLMAKPPGSGATLLPAIAI